jgi:hypothetical protein
VMSLASCVERSYDCDAIPPAEHARPSQPVRTQLTASRPRQHGNPQATPLLCCLPTTQASSAQKRRDEQVPGLVDSIRATMPDGGLDRIGPLPREAGDGAACVVFGWRSR